LALFTLVQRLICHQILKIIDDKLRVTFKNYSRFAAIRTIEQDNHQISSKTKYQLRRSENDNLKRGQNNH